MGETDLKMECMNAEEISPNTFYMGSWSLFDIAPDFIDYNALG
jgi:hypothetical protein